MCQTHKQEVIRELVLFVTKTQFKHHLVTLVEIIRKTLKHNTLIRHVSHSNSSETPSANIGGKNAKDVK